MVTIAITRFLKLKSINFLYWTNARFHIKYSEFQIKQFSKLFTGNQEAYNLFSWPVRTITIITKEASGRRANVLHPRTNKRDRKRKKNRNGKSPFKWFRLVVIVRGFTVSNFYELFH